MLIIPLYTQLFGTRLDGVTVGLYTTTSCMFNKGIAEIQGFDFLTPFPGH